jgi:ligand-binding SRPBCC domain-containing protein
MQNTRPNNIKSYEHRSVIPASLKAVRDFHERQEALSELTPYPIFVQVIRDDRVSLTQGELEFRLWFGPIPVRWLAQHESVQNNHDAFGDIMVEGPMALWEHQHILNEKPDGVELVDRVSFAHHSGWRGWLTRLFFDGLPLRFLFYYRHWRTRHIVSKGS